MTVQPIRSKAWSHTSQNEPNPLLEGFRLVTTETEMIKLIARNPFRDAVWAKNNQDIDFLRSYMQQLVVPTRLAQSVGVALHRTLKVSLHQQDPNKQENQRRYFATAKSLVRPEFFRGIHDGMCLIGITGLGKSHLLKAALSTIPQRINRTDIHGLKEVVQINWLYIDLTAIPSIEALALRLVAEVDSVLECKGKLLEITFRGVVGANAKMEAAIRVLKTHFCGMIVFDEIQPTNFAVATAAPLRDWMLRIANLDIGLVFSGNPLGFELQSPKSKKSRKSGDEEKVYSTQIMRRLFSAEKIRIDPASNYQDEDWVFFSKAINGCRLSGAAHPYDPALESLKFRKSAGFPDFHVELHCSIETILAKNPGQVVNSHLIELAAKKSTKLKEMKSLIDAFNQRDPMALRQCLDVDFAYYQELWNSESKAAAASKPIGPVGMVAVPTSKVDVAKSLVDDQKSANRRIEKNKANAQKTLNPAAAAVRANYLDELEKLISGKKQDENQD